MGSDRERAPGPRARRTRAAILDAAEERFARQGFAATRLEDVAGDVGIRRASIVYHFPDKRALYDAVLDRLFAALLAQVQPVLTGSGGLGERVEQAVSLWVDFVARRPGFARLLLREVADRSGPATPAALRQVSPFVEMVRKLLETPRDDPTAPRASVEPVHVASTIAGATVFFVAVIPSLAPGLGIDPDDPAQLEAHREQVLEVARKILGTGEVDA